MSLAFFLFYLPFSFHCSLVFASSSTHSASSHLHSHPPPPQLPPATSPAIVRHLPSVVRRVPSCQVLSAASPHPFPLSAGWISRRLRYRCNFSCDGEGNELESTAAAEHRLERRRGGAVEHGLKLPLLLLPYPGWIPRRGGMTPTTGRRYAAAWLGGRPASPLPPAIICLVPSALSHRHHRPRLEATPSTCRLSTSRTQPSSPPVLSVHLIPATDLAHQMSSTTWSGAP
jgi:hypothetical protein